MVFIDVFSGLTHGGLDVRIDVRGTVFDAKNQPRYFNERYFGEPPVYIIPYTICYISYIIYFMLYII